jgi:hypothetical protein
VIAVLQVLRILPISLVVAVLVSSPERAAAQAFTPPAGVGSVTFAWQWVDNTGHRLTDGYFVERGQSVSTSVLAEIEYGVTDRLSVTFGAPYVGAKYTGAQPPPSGLAADKCGCWQSSFQDIGTSVRYRFGDGGWALTPLVRVDLPTHGYPYQGEAVVGRNLREVLVGAGGGYRFTGVLPGLSVQAIYTYAFVEKPLEDVSVNRSNGAFDVGYAFGRRFYVRGTTAAQHTHGGLRAGSVTGNPFPFPGELNTPVRWSQRDRLIKVKYWQVGGGAAYTMGPMDVFGSLTKYVWGRDAHNGWVYNLGLTYYFDVGRATASFAADPGASHPGSTSRRP